MLLPNGKPLTIEFLDSNSAMQPHTMPFIQNLGKLGIQANLAHRRPGAAQEPHRSLRLRRRDRGAPRTDTPGVDLRVVYSSQAAKPERLAQSCRRRRSGGRRPHRDDRDGEIEGRTQYRLPGARSRAARWPLLGADVVSRYGVDRLLGRLFAARPAAEARAPARPAPGGGTKGRPRRLASDEPLTPRLVEAG